MQQKQRHPLFYSTQSSSLSKHGAITHNATRPPTVWLEIAVCYASPQTLQHLETRSDSL